jgi:hypothetical protein
MPRSTLSAATAASWRAVEDVKRYARIWSPGPRTARAPRDGGFWLPVQARAGATVRAVPHDQELKHLRDRALLQALRTVEITRSNVADLQRHGDSWSVARPLAVDAQNFCRTRWA